MAIETTTSVDVQTLTPFKRFIMTIGALPTSYLESMTYAELLMWFCNYLQETVIPTINNNGEAVEELQQLYEELRTYVNDYFENLDVQEEINNKLDDMAESGQLTDIIAQYLGLSGMLTFTTVADMKLADNLVAGSTCETLGYHSLSDGGSARYKVRTITNADTVDEALLIALSDNTLVAELVIDDYIKTKQFGCYGDGTHDDSIQFKKCIDYALESSLPIYVQGTVVLSSSYDLMQNDKQLIITGESSNLFRSDHWHGPIGSTIKLINGSHFIDGDQYRITNNNLPWLLLNMKNVAFENEYTQYSEGAYENQYVINEVRLISSTIDNISTRCLNFLKGSFCRSSILQNSRFIACYIFMKCGTNVDMISDSIIINNYISGSNTGYTFDKHNGASVRFENNYVDYFQYIFSPSNLSNTFLSIGNIYDQYFKIFEPSTAPTTLYAGFISQNDKFHPCKKSFCISKGWMTNDDVKCSVRITERTFNIQFINPQIRMPETDEGDDVFMYGDLYGPTSKGLSLKIINPTYWTAVNNQKTKEPVLTELFNVKNSGATLEQHFNFNQFSYEPSIIDRVTELPQLTRDTRYIVPPFYKCYNITDGKLYMFGPTGAFVEVTS